MMRKYWFVVLVLLSVNLCAQEAGFLPVKNVDEVKAKIKSSHQNTQSFKSQFVQEKHLSFMEDKAVSKGEFSMKRERKMRIEYTSPFAYLVVMNGDKLTVKDGKKVTKIDTRSDKSFRQLNEVLVGSLNGDVDNVKGFDVKYFQSKEQYMVQLVPSSGQAIGLYDKIKVFLDHKTMQLARVDLIEKSGDVTKMKFEQIQTNLNIPDAAFVVR
jgi:outer membrane lipoprotein-sorting protein